MEDQKRVRIKAVVMWAYLNKPNSMSDKYQVELTNLSSAAVDALEELGITPKTDPKKPEKGVFITCYSVNPIRAYDADGEVLTSDVLVGNGSRATASITSYHWEKKGKKGVSPTLRRLTITDLVEYQGGGGGDEHLEAL